VPGDLPVIVLDPAEPARLSLAPGDVHVWCLAAAEFDDPALLARLDALMTPDERARQQRLIRPTDRHLQRLARALVRVLCSSYGGLPPADWRYGTGPRGKPFLVGPEVPLPLSFNLSHTDGMVAAAFTLDAEVGVDVERLDRRPAELDVARRFFAPAEVAALEAAPETDRQELFFAFWTLKEAYIKARGLGLSIPLSKVAFDVLSDPPRVSFAPPIDDRPDRWQFIRHAPGARHRLAAAVDRRTGQRRILTGVISPPSAAPPVG
jgi:4'-phosphopantetheinyl transferase